MPQSRQLCGRRCVWQANREAVPLISVARCPPTRTTRPFDDHCHGSQHPRGRARPRHNASPRHERIAFGTGLPHGATAYPGRASSSSRTLIADASSTSSARSRFPHSTSLAIDRLVRRADHQAVGLGRADEMAVLPRTRQHGEVDCPSSPTAATDDRLGFAFRRRPASPQDECQAGPWLRPSSNQAAPHRIFVGWGRLPARYTSPSLPPPSSHVVVRDRHDLWTDRTVWTMASLPDTQQYTGLRIRIPAH